MDIKKFFEESSIAFDAVEEPLGGTPSIVVNFQMDYQEEDQWCWAAASKSVCNFYDPNNNWTQCLIVGVALQNNNCCSQRFQCNRANVLETPLQIVRCYRTTAQPLSYQEIEHELNNGNVICARIGWRPRGGHFVSIYGCSTNNGIEYLYVGDPWFGDTIVTMQEFAQSYKNNGFWTHAYLTANNNVL